MEQSSQTSRSTCESLLSTGQCSPATAAHSSILFRSDNGSVVLLDIPRTLEEAQVPPGHWPSVRIFSSPPPSEPFHTPEPRDGASATDYWLRSSQNPAALVADLMIGTAARNALDELARSRYPGPFCLPRHSSPSPDVPATVPEANAVVRIPQAADFLHGSLQELRQTFLEKAPQFLLIVLDPPWPNRSARRKANSYNTVANIQEMRDLLLSVPVPSHLSPDGLVAVWITNKPSILDFLTSPKDGLFASWGLELVTEWTWLKVTSTGEPIFDIESTWRKPWERLLIAKRKGAKIPDLLKPKIIIAVPETHSRKPNLRGLFQEVLGKGYLGLEVFARNLTSGWWSWGDEVLRFQGSEHWQAVND